MVILACLLTMGAAAVPLAPDYTGPDSTAVPIELVEGQRAVVQATLEGRGPYRLAVETGSPNVQLSPRLVRELALPRAGGGGRGSLFRLDSLQIGDVIVRGLAVGSDEALERIGVDGVLGLDAYADLVLTVDYPAARLVLSRDSLPTPDGADVLPAVRVGPFIGIPVDAGGVREVGVVDTQGGILFQAIPEEAERLAFSGTPRVVGRAIVGGGAPVEVKEARLAGDLKLGRHVFHQPRIAVHRLPADIPSRMTIGTQALRHFCLTIDQRSMRVRLARADTSATVE
jgi:Aspartyl protease